MKRLLPPVLIGYFGTGTMPLQLGEVLRAHTAARRLQCRFLTVLSSLAVERVFDILGLVILLTTQLLFGTPPGNTIWFVGLIMAGASVFLLALLTLATARPALLHGLAKRLTRSARPELRHAIIGHVDAVIAGFSVLRRPSKFVEILFLSVVQWMLMWGCVWASLQAFGLALPGTASLAVLVAAVIGMLLPAAPGYIGTFQLAFTLTLAPFGVEKADAFAASLFYQVSLWVPLIIVGMFCLRRADLTIRRIMEVDDSTGEFRALQDPSEFLNEDQRNT